MSGKSTKSRHGFTLPETLLSLLIFSFLSFCTFQVFRTNQRVYVEQDEVLNMQQNGRVAMDWMTRDLMKVGGGVPGAGVVSSLGRLYPIIPGNSSGGLPDTIKVLVNLENTPTELTMAMASRAAAIKVERPTNFDAGSLAMICGFTEEGPVTAELFEITGISLEGGNLLHGWSPPWNPNQNLTFTFVPPTTVSEMTVRTYYVERSDPAHPKLVVRENESTPLVVADDIENLQITYDLATGEEDVPDPVAVGWIDRVCITIVARTRDADPDWEGGLHSITGSSDHYRRMTLVSNVLVRNLAR